MSKSHGTLYCRPPLKSFRQGEDKALERYLAEVERNTTICPIADPEELVIGPDGTTRRGGYRFTSNSFRHVAQLLAPGLSKFLPDLAGEVLRKDVDEEMLDAHHARDIFNKLAHLRFPALRRCRLLRDEKAKTIDGVVGQKHRSLENLNMLDATRSALESNGSDLRLYAASVASRKLMLWYRACEPMFTRDIHGYPWSFYHGYYFRNSESTGTSVRGGFTVFTKHGSCLTPFTKQSRVSHIGRDFTKRLSKMFQYILGSEVPRQALATSVDSMTQTSLGYTATDDKERRKFKASFIKALGSLGLPQRWAGEAFEDTLAIGSLDMLGRQPLLLTSRDYAQRTHFDIFCPLVRMARDLPMAQRERVEQVAYKVLTGKFEI
jgi:hypothetical protein